MSCALIVLVASVVLVLFATVTLLLCQRGGADGPPPNVAFFLMEH